MKFNLPKFPKLKNIKFRNILSTSLIVASVISIVSLFLTLLLMSKLNFSITDLLSGSSEPEVTLEPELDLTDPSSDQKLVEMINQLKVKDVEFEKSLQGLKASNTKIITTAESCKLFVYNYFLFFEKANELFANGTTGCAVRYIESKNPDEFPNGCYRLDADKSNFQNLRGWYQDPDDKYFNSLKKFYDGYKKHQSECLKKLN